MNLMYVGLSEHKTWASMGERGVGGWFLLPITSYQWYSTFTIIGLTQLLTLPVITLTKHRYLFAYGITCALLHLLLSGTFWFQYTMEHPTQDGNRYGFSSRFTWLTLRALC
jgi:hypothetical protein